MRLVSLHRYVHSLTLTTPVSLILLGGCATTQVSPTDDKQSAPVQQSTKQDPSTAETIDVSLLGSTVTQFESALSRRDCQQVKNLKDSLIAPPASYGGSVFLATLWCAQQESPNDPETNERLTEELNRIEGQKTSLIDPVFIEELRAEALRRSGQTAEARSVTTKAIGISAQRFMSLVSGHVLRNELIELERGLSGKQSELLESVKSSLSDPMSQALALVKLDDLIAQLPQGDAKNNALLVRLKLFSAIEYSFASQLTTLEELRIRGENTKADGLAVTLKKQFPSKPHQDRINALVGPEVMNAPEVNPSQASNLCIPNSPSFGGLADRSELTAERAIQLARIALNDGKPGDAVQTLDGLPDVQKSDKTRNLRREASEAHIRDLRRKANDLFQRGNVSSDSQTKMDSFEQCRQILERILNLYPEANRYTRVKIKKFLDSVSDQLIELRKAQTK